MFSDKKNFLRKASAILAAAAGSALALSVFAGSADASVNSTAHYRTVPFTTGATKSTTTTAGYEASGRNFRYISALLTVPDDSFSPWDGIYYPQTYVQLSNGSLNESGTPTGDQYIRAGIESCAVATAYGDSCTSGSWVAYIEAFDNSLSGPYLTHFITLADVNGGDGVGFSIYYNQQGNELSFTITPPNTGVQPEQFYKTQAYGAVFDHAGGFDDWTNSSGTPIALPAVSPFPIGSILQGAITTGTGNKGSFTGPWTTSMVQATSNGLPYPSGTLRSYPTSLYRDNLKANGAYRNQDAFGVYAR